MNQITHIPRDQANTSATKVDHIHITLVDYMPRIKVENTNQTLVEPMFQILVASIYPMLEVFMQAMQALLPPETLEDNISAIWHNQRAQLRINLIVPRDSSSYHKPKRTSL